MPRLKKRFDNALLTQIRSAVYHGSNIDAICSRLSISRRTWHRWRQHAVVKTAITQAVDKRWKHNVKAMGWNYEEVEADFDRMYAELDAISADYKLESYSKDGYHYVVETQRTGDGITRTTTKSPVLQAVEELLTKDYL